MKIIISVLLLSFIGCKTNNKVMQTSNETKTAFEPVFSSSPPVLVYKTKANYNNLVPVILSDDKTEIVSYPHPKDLIKGSGFPLPFILNDGYLLDNRGINKNVAFLKITYDVYSKLSETPTLKELYNLIIDKNPLIELCDCGNRNSFTDIQSQLNSLIDSKALRTKCITIK